MQRIFLRIGSKQEKAIEDRQRNRSRAVVQVVNASPVTNQSSVQLGDGSVVPSNDFSASRRFTGKAMLLSDDGSTMLTKVGRV